MYVIWSGTGAGAAFGGVTVRAAAESSGVNRNMAILFCHKLREVIFAAPDADTPELLAGEIKVDESYFGGRRKGRRGRGAAGRIPVSGLLKRSGKVQVVIVPNAFSDTLIPIIREKSGLIASSTPMPSKAMTCAMYRSSTTSGSITPSCSPIRATTSLGSRTSGTRPAPPEGLQRHPQAALPPCSSRSANGASTTSPPGGCRKRWRGGGSSNSSNPVYVRPFS